MKDNDKIPPVDLDMLTMALQSDSVDSKWWLDRQTGEVIPAPDAEDNPTDRMLLKAREQQPERFVDIEPLSSDVLIDLMKSFICTLGDERLCQQLDEAMKKQQPVWHFKKVLAGYPDDEDTWYGFKDDFYALQARQWLRDQGHEFEVRIFGESEDSSEQELASQKDNNVLLELEIKSKIQRQAYLITQENDEGDGFTLTAYQGSTENIDSLQVVAESRLNKNQLDFVNQQLSNINLLYDPLNESGADKLMARLKVNKPSLQAELTGSCYAGSVFDQIYNQFCFLLGLSRL